MGDKGNFRQALKVRVQSQEGEHGLLFLNRFISISRWLVIEIQKMDNFAVKIIAVVIAQLIFNHA